MDVQCVFCETEVLIDFRRSAGFKQEDTDCPVYRVPDDGSCSTQTAQSPGLSQYSRRVLRHGNGDSVCGGSERASDLSCLL